MVKKLKEMTENERLCAWADHMLGNKENKELKQRGVKLQFMTR